MSTETHELDNEGGADAATTDAATTDAVTTDTVTTDTVSAEPVSAEPMDAEPEAVDTGSESSPADDADQASQPAEGVAVAEGAAPTKRLTRRESLEAEGDVAADFLEALLDIADMAGDIDVDIDGDRAAVSIVDSEDGRVPRRLVGPDGKVLEALQELTRLAVQTETGERSRLMLDVAGHRAARKAEVVAVAQGVIAAVRETGQQVEMDPMTAFERKIVHDEVLAAGLSSESDGVEPRRFVIVLPTA